MSQYIVISCLFKNYKMEKDDIVTHKITGKKLKVIKVMEDIAVCESEDYYHVIFHLYDNVHICKIENLVKNENGI